MKRNTERAVVAVSGMIAGAAALALLIWTGQVRLPTRAEQKAQAAQAAAQAAWAALPQDVQEATVDVLTAWVLLPQDGREVLEALKATEEAWAALPQDVREVLEAAYREGNRESER